MSTIVEVEEGLIIFIIKNIIMLFIAFMTINAYGHTYVCPKPDGSWHVEQVNCKIGPGIPAYLCTLEGDNLKDWPTNTEVYTAYKISKINNAEYINRHVLGHRLRFHNILIATVNDKQEMVCVYAPTRNKYYTVQVGRLINAKQCVQSKRNLHAAVCK